MSEMNGGGIAKGFATLSIDGVPVAAPQRVNPPAEAVVGQFSAEVNVHGCTQRQVAVAVITNVHTHDPHPHSPGAWVARHPIYLVAVDENGNEGAPAESTLEEMRATLSARFDYVSPSAPPEDSSHRMAL